MRFEKTKKNNHVILLAFSLLYVFSLLYILPFSFAAGGGGGGSGGAGGGGGSGGGGDNLYFTILGCDERGVISFTQNPKNVNFTIENLDDSSVLANIQGEWDGTTFTSDEAAIIKPGRYRISDSKNGNRTFECPGLKFSCKLVGLSISQCIADESHIRAFFNLTNAKTEDMKIVFTLKDSNRNLEHQKGSYSKELKGLTISQIGANLYALEVNRIANVDVLQISHPKCIGKYYVYSTIRCREGATQKEEPGKKLKCGGYLNIQDRVKCRIGLRDAQKNEYENFFPEECKAREDSEQCLKFYQAVQECWDFPNGNARISCVKKQIKLGDVFNEKANCNALDSTKRENCNKELREKAHALVKFRLYNLEEEAEKFMEHELLTQEDVVDFVVKMEQSKLEFNAAKSKEERKTIILQARQHWIELVKKIKQ